MDCQEECLPFVLQRCGRGYWDRTIQLNQDHNFIGSFEITRKPTLLKTPTFPGRSEGSVLLHSLYVSRQHAQIFYKDEKWLLMDLNSFNSTFLMQQGGDATKLEPYNPVPMYVNLLILSVIAWEVGWFCLKLHTKNSETTENLLCFIVSPPATTEIWSVWASVLRNG
jgi:hypothetical protein